MAITTYSAWLADGKPWKPAVPVNDLASCLRRQGYVVYILGDTSHQTAQPPEDHVPFSNTPWPGRQPYPYVLACDIMAPPAGKGLPSLAELAQQIFDDRQAGHPGVAWVKYMNWEPRGGAGPCYHDAWQPTHARSVSTDRGHIHISGRTDFVVSGTAADYDPVARIRGEDVSDLFPRYGEKGEGVKYLQRRLRDLKYLPAAATIDGVYGDGVAAAVKKYRADHSADPVGDGKVVSAWQVNLMDVQLAALRGKPGPAGPAGETGPAGPSGTLPAGTVLTLDAHNATVTAVTPPV